MSSEATGGNADFTQSGTSSAGASAANGTAGAGAGAGYASGADLSFTIGSNQIGSGTPGAGSAGSSGSGGDGTGGGGGTASLSLGGDSSGGGSSGASAGLTDGAGTATTGGDGNAAAQQYYFAGTSRPLGFSLLPSSTGADGLADSLTPGADSTPLTASLTDSTPTSGSSSLDLFSLNSSNEALYGPGPGSLFDGPNAGGSPIDQYAKGGNGGGNTHGGSSGGGSHGGGGSNTYTSAAPNGLQFFITWDSSVNRAPSVFITDIEKAVDYFATQFGSLTGSSSAPTIVKLDVGYGEVGGQRLPGIALGESMSSLALVNYGSLSSKLPSSLSIPSKDPLSDRQHYYWASTAEARTLGLTTDTGLDGAVGFSSHVSWDPSTGGYDLVGVAEHEISETMGRIALLGATLTDTSTGQSYSPSYSVLDLYRFNADGHGQRVLSGGTASWFSTDGGSSALQYFNPNAGLGDLGDWSGTMASNDAYNYAAGTGQLRLSSADTQVMHALGYTLAS